MNLSEEIKMWLERRRNGLVEEIDSLQEELNFVSERLEGKHTEKLPRQYYHIPGREILVHGSNLTPPYYEFLAEYQKFLRQSEDNN